MGNSITGREAIVAVKQAAVWGTAVACGAGDGLLVTKESFKQALSALDDESVGQNFITYSDRGQIEVTGSLEGYMRYEGWDLLIAALMGAAGTPTQQEATAAYTNSYTLTPHADGLFHTLCLKKKSDVVWEYPSVKFSSMKLSGEMNAPVMVEFEGQADQLERASSTNTTTTLGDVTYPDQGNRIIFNSSSRFRVNDQSAIALASGDEIHPTSFEFTFGRKQEADVTAGNVGIDEPYDNGFPEIELTMKFPRYNDTNDAFFDDWEAFTSKKMDIYFEGSTIEGAYNYSFLISLPHIKVMNPESVIDGPGVVPMSMSFKVLAPESAPTGMTGITNPFQIDVQNTLTTSPLA